MEDAHANWTLLVSMRLLSFQSRLGKARPDLTSSYVPQQDLNYCLYLPGARFRGGDRHLPQTVTLRWVHGLHASNQRPRPCWSELGFQDWILLRDVLSERREPP